MKYIDPASCEKYGGIESAKAGFCLKWKAINEMPKRFAEVREKMTRLMKLQAEKGVRVVPKEKLRRDSVWFRMRIRLKLFWFGIRRKLYELRLRLCLWLKPKADCHCCCLICKYFDNCRWEIKQDADV